MNHIKIAAIVVLFALSGCAGMQPAKETGIENIIDVPGLSKDHIYNGTKIWIADTFRSTKAVIESDDKDAGLLIGKGIISYPCNGIECLGTGDYKISFTMRIDIKDQKFRITYSNINFIMPPSVQIPSGLERGVVQSEFDATRPALLALTDKLRTTIEKEKTTTNW